MTKKHLSLVVREQFAFPFTQYRDDFKNFPQHQYDKTQPQDILDVTEKQLPVVLDCLSEIRKNLVDELSSYLKEIEKKETKLSKEDAEELKKKFE